MPAGAWPATAGGAVVPSARTPASGSFTDSALSQTFAGRTRARSPNTASHGTPAAENLAIAVARAASSPATLGSIVGPGAAAGSAAISAWTASSSRLLVRDLAVGSEVQEPESDERDGDRDRDADRGQVERVLLVWTASFGSRLTSRIATS